MQYTIVLTKKVVKFLSKRKGERIVKDIQEIFSLLKENPYTSQLDITKIKGYDDMYRVRKGKYRILYEVVERKITIIIFSIGNRGEVYKEL